MKKPKQPKNVVPANPGVSVVPKAVKAAVDKKGERDLALKAGVKKIRKSLTRK